MKENVREELYHLRDDAKEQDNLAADPAMKADPGTDAGDPEPAHGRPPDTHVQPSIPDDSGQPRSRLGRPATSRHAVRPEYRRAPRVDMPAHIELHLEVGARSWPPGSGLSEAISTWA